MGIQGYGMADESLMSHGKLESDFSVTNKANTISSVDSPSSTTADATINAMLDAEKVYREKKTADRLRRKEADRVWRQQQSERRRLQLSLLCMDDMTQESVEVNRLDKVFVLWELLLDLQGHQVKELYLGDELIGEGIAHSCSFSTLGVCDGAAMHYTIHLPEPSHMKQKPQHLGSRLWQRKSRFLRRKSPVAKMQAVVDIQQKRVESAPIFRSRKNRRKASQSKKQTQPFWSNAWTFLYRPI